MADIIEEKDVDVEQGVHNYSTKKSYVEPTDPLVKEKLEWFQDQKLALMMHWGPYSQLGIVESWALSEDDSVWSWDDVNWTDSVKQFQDDYFGLNKSFNPVRFQPEKWADFAADNGFKYLIFTTKHHDGFCMWDTEYTDYKSTHNTCPFHSNPKSDIVKNVFNSFRDKGIGIAAYFSKADWNTPYYWNYELAKGKPMWRGPSYNPKERPEMWGKFKDFTKNQVLELCRDYGPVDILWFDAGWVCEKSNQDIELGKIVDAARKIQPGILSADRTVGGAYENYVTPEQCIPDEPPGVPWESCITIGTQFSFKYEDTYKSGRELVCLLAEIVAKGGNLALNIGPQPDGSLPKGAVKSATELGNWLKGNGEAIYSTRVIEPYFANNTAFTQNEKAIYAIKLYPGGNEAVAKQIYLPLEFDKMPNVTFLETGEIIKAEKAEKGIYVNVPDRYRRGVTPISLTYRIEK